MSEGNDVIYMDANGNEKALASSRPPYGSVAAAKRLPAIGDDVIYVDEHGKDRPAKIVQVWEAGWVGLVAFFPQKNPAEYVGTVQFDEAGVKKTWHWHLPRFEMTLEGAVG